MLEKYQPISYNEFAVSNDDRIYQAVTNNPGLKAKEIARMLGLSRKQVNVALYGELKKDVIRNDNFCWYPKSNGIPSENNLSQTPSMNEKSGVFEDAR